MNPFVATFLLGPALLADGMRGSLDLSDRTELRGGWFGLPTDPALNAETVPSLALFVASRATDISLTYAPRFALSDIQTGFNPSQLQSGSAYLAWHPRFFRFSLSEYASYGTLNYSALQLPSSALPNTVRVDPFLRRIISYEGSSTAFTGLFTPDKRWTTRLTLSYSLSGAAKEEDRVILPLYRGPRAEAALEYGFVHTWASITRASAEQAIVSTGHEYIFMQGAQGIRHQFGISTDAEIVAGITEVRSDLPGPLPPPFWNTYPTVEGAMNYVLPYYGKVNLLVRAALSPGVNRVTGLVSQQIQALGRASYRAYPWAATFEGGFADSIHDEPGRLTVTSGQLAMGYFLSRFFEVEAGGRLAWQTVFGIDGATVQKIGFAALTVREPTMQF